MVAPLLAAIVAAAVWASSAAAYPNQPVKVIVPYPAGGTSDILARVVATRLEQRLASRSSSKTARARAA